MWQCGGRDCGLESVPQWPPFLTRSAPCVKHRSSLINFNFYGMSLVFSPWLLGERLSRLTLKISKIPFSPNTSPGLEAEAPAGVSQKNLDLTSEDGTFSCISGYCCALIKSAQVPEPVFFLGKMARLWFFKPHSLLLQNFLVVAGTQTLVSVVVMC